MKLAPAPTVLLALLALALPPAFADDAHRTAAPATGATQPYAEGTVKKVDKAAGKLTIAHGPLANLDMPPMTMVFKAGDPAMLDKVQPGDKIRFVADRVGGVFVVKSLELAK
jgi:Cu(I)/Ag(I) efflux system periplasmic protein CusF